MGFSPNQDKGAQNHNAGISRSALQRVNTAGSQHFTENFLPQSGAALQGRVIKGLTLLSPLLLLLSFLLSILVLCGWLGNIDVLKHLLYNQVTGFPTVFWLAFTTLAAAPAVLNLQGNKFVLSLRVIARIALCVAFICGMALWLEHLLAQDWNLNYPIFQPPGDAPTLTLPGSAPVDVSFCIVVTSVTALLLDLFGAKRPLLFQTMSLLMALPSFILVLACLFGVGDAVDVFCAYQGCVRFKYLNYTILFCLHTAIFLARPTQGITSLLAMDSQGGRQVRLSIVGIVLMIPVACVLLAAKRNELVNEPTAIVLGLISFILTAGLLGAYGARKIDKIEMEKQATEQSLQELSSVSDSHFNYKTLCLECGREFPDGIEACPYDSAPLTRLLDKLAQGSVFADKYEIGESLGSGGMSTVYKAQHLFLDKVVAIKLLNQQLTGDIKAVQRFQLEAKAAFNLSHPNLLGVYDFGLSRDGQAYIVMDYLEGESLSEIIRRDKTVSLSRALPIFLDICRGLLYAHEQGVLHRDIKPSNIMVLKTADGKETAKIVDFGLAKVIDENAMKMTQTGDIYGSPLYMSPEQCRGLPLDQRSDIYSLGVLMYETLSGRVPITGKGVYDTFNRKLTETPAPFEPSLMVPEWLEKLILSLLKAEPEGRPATVRFMITSIGKYVK